MKKRIVLMSATLLLGVTPLIGSGASVFAAENDNNNVSTIQSNSAITNDEKNVLDKLTPIFPYFFIENNKLSISLTDEELTNKFGYHADFIATIHKITKAQLGSPLGPAGLAISGAIGVTMNGVFPNIVSGTY